MPLQRGGSSTLPPDVQQQLRAFLGTLAFRDKVAFGDIVARSITASHIRAATITADLIVANAISLGVTLDYAPDVNITPYGAWVDIATGITLSIAKTTDFVVFANTITADVANLQPGGDEIDFRVRETVGATTVIETHNIATAQAGLASTYSVGGVPFIYLLSGFAVGNITLLPQIQLINGSGSGTLAMTTTDTKIWAFCLRQTG